VNRWWILLTLPLLLNLGCRATLGSMAETGGMSVHVAPDELIGMEVYTAEDVLRLAAEAFDADDIERAYALYLRYLQEFPRTDGEVEALFNAALCAELLQHFDDAVELYRAYLGRRPSADAKLTAQFRLAECLVGAEQWADARALIEELLQRDDVGASDQFALMVKRAWVRGGAGELDWAEDELERLSRYYRYDRGRTLGGHSGALAYFYLGEVFRKKAEAVELASVDDLEIARMELNAKAELILAAQDAYLESIRIGIHEWVPRAGYRLGSLYEQFRQDILTAPDPQGVQSDTDRELYQEVLSEQTVVLLLKARTVYEKVARKAAEVEIQDAWVASIQESLEAIENNPLVRTALDEARHGLGPPQAAP